jgi:RNA polymerase sigma-70 factor (ECF subfamily)
VTNLNDQLLIRIKRGDTQAFELLFRKYYVRLCCFSNRIIDNPEEAREVVQDVFAKLWEYRKEIRIEKSLVSYLFKTTQNNSINILRRRQMINKYVALYKLVYIEHREISTEQTMIATELNDNIKGAIAKIPPKCRKIFELSRIEGLKHQEIASLLKISIKTVEAHMSKALSILRIELKDYK